MSDISLQISIPLDEDGFLEMECDYCKERFMLHKDTYENTDNIDFFCPICGMPNRINTFFCPEVLERAQQEVANYTLDQIDKQLGKTMRQINCNGLIKMSVKKTPISQLKELYAPINEYVLSHQKCCNVDVKTHEFDKEVGLYCPICGGVNFE